VGAINVALDHDVALNIPIVKQLTTSLLHTFFSGGWRMLTYIFVRDWAGLSDILVCNPSAFQLAASQSSATDLLQDMETSQQSNPPPYVLDSPVILWIKICVWFHHTFSLSASADANNTPGPDWK